MKIRRRLGKILLSVTAMFWASCSDNSQPLYGVISVEDPVPESSEAIESSSSIPSEGLSNSSESTESSSSDTPESSSSSPAEVLSSSSAGFRLASDTSVTCSQKPQSTNKCLYTICDYEPPVGCEEEMLILENNKSKTLEELIKEEDRLEKCSDAAPVYGSGPCHCVGYEISVNYTCSDGRIFPYAKDGLVYTKEEYEKKFPSSSSSKVESSSSAVPSPLCQKTDFIYQEEVVEYTSNEKLDSLTSAGENISNNLKKCIYSSRSYNIPGLYAKTQICDGDTTVNPRYQAKLDSIREAFDKIIEDCKAAEVPTDSTTTPADSTVAPPDSLPPT